MDLSDTICNEIKRLYDACKTQERVAAKCNVNRGRIPKTLSRPGYCRGMKIETVDIPPDALAAVLKTLKGLAP